MSYIPDVRSRVEKCPYTGREVENHYYEGYLDEEDRRYVEGYDYAVDEVLENIFDNIGGLSLVVEGEDMDLAKVLENHPEIRQKLKEAFEERFETDRNMMIVSMISSYSEEKYDQLKKISDVVNNVVQMPQKK